MCIFKNPSTRSKHAIALLKGSNYVQSGDAVKIRSHVAK